MPSLNIYDQRYLGNYRELLSGYEIARWNAHDHFISKIMKLDPGIDILDYGAGSGLHFDLWKKIFPKSKLDFCDISKVAMKSSHC